MRGAYGAREQVFVAIGKVVPKRWIVEQIRRRRVNVVVLEIGGECRGGTFE